MSDEEIFSEINKDMMNLAMHEAGSSWMEWVHYYQGIQQI